LRTCLIRSEEYHKVHDFYQRTGDINEVNPLTELKEIITRQNLHNLAGNRSFGRGEDYFENGLVEPITEKPGVISAKVHGSHTYETRLKIVAAPQVYKTILGKPGLAEYRRLAEKEWSRVEEKEPGSRDTGYSSKRRRITSIMESLAKADGDVDALIAVKKRDLSHPYSYLGIAEICKEAGCRGCLQASCRSGHRTKE